MEPLVSILIPAHNAARWIAETIQSALGQTWPRKEIIIVDDGSTDETLAIAEKHCSAGVIVVSQEKQGAAAARNKALFLSHGDYIQWLDADDLLASDKISKQVDAINRCISKRTLLSGAWGSFCYRTSAAKFNPTPLWCDLSPVEWFMRKWNHNAHMQTATWLISRELTEDAGPWDVRLLSNDDGEYLCRVIKASDAIKFVPEARVFYRVTGSSRLSYCGQSEAKVKAQFLGVQLQIQHVLSLEDSDRTRSACLQKLRTWLGNFYPQKAELILQVQQLAISLGSRLELPPRLSWKYAWIQKLFGWTAARGVRMYYNRIKSTAIRFWDEVLLYMEERTGRSKRAESSNITVT
jgi:glycosyltransferase involved in cell wall biosynthesis